jgi:gliding motility-associated protein GldC
MKKSEIRIFVELDENRVPEKISWEASDGEGLKESKTLLLSVWDKEEGLTMGIDLWTKEMFVDEMNIHFHQIFVKLADTYMRATKNKEAADMIEKFSSDFADKLNLKKDIERK